MTKRKWTNQEVRDWMEKNHSYIYYNPSDSNLFVRKRFGIGWTANLGKWAFCAFFREDGNETNGQYTFRPSLFII